MQSQERRKHHRLPLRLQVLCRKVGHAEKKPSIGHTVNVSTGGLLIRTTEETFNHGDLLSIEFSVPPNEGTLDFGEMFSGFAKVIRISDIKHHLTQKKTNSSHFGVAVEFCALPKLCV